MAYKLYRETDKGWYWIALFLSALLFGISEWLSILLPLGRQDFATLHELGDIAGAILFAVAC